jgi:hypothetical protein
MYRRASFFLFLFPSRGGVKSYFFPANGRLKMEKARPKCPPQQPSSLPSPHFPVPQATALLQAGPRSQPCPDPDGSSTTALLHAPRRSPLIPPHSPPSPPPARARSPHSPSPIHPTIRCGLLQNPPHRRPLGVSRRCRATVLHPPAAVHERGKSSSAWTGVNSRRRREGRKTQLPGLN